MKTTIFALALSLLLAACLQSPPNGVAELTQPLDPVAKSSSRISARVKTSTFASVDGFSYSVRGDITFYDNVLKHECVIITTLSPSVCVPTGDASLNGWWAGPQYNIDASHLSPDIELNPALTIRIGGRILRANGPSGDPIFVVYDPSKTGDPTNWYGYSFGSVTPQTMGPERFPSAIYNCDSGGCDHMAPDSKWRFFAVGVPASMSSFATLSKTNSTEILP